MLLGCKQAGHHHRAGCVGDCCHRLFNSTPSIRKVNAKMNNYFINHLLCASPACQEKVRGQEKEGGGKEWVRRERENDGGGGGRRKGKIEKERGRKK